MEHSESLSFLLEQSFEKAGIRIVSREADGVYALAYPWEREEERIWIPGTAQLEGRRFTIYAGPLRLAEAKGPLEELLDEISKLRAEERERGSELLYSPEEGEICMKASLDTAYLARLSQEMEKTVKRPFEALIRVTPALILVAMGKDPEGDLP